MWFKKPRVILFNGQHAEHLGYAYDSLGSTQFTHAIVGLHIGNQRGIYIIPVQDFNAQSTVLYIPGDYTLG